MRDFGDYTAAREFKRWTIADCARTASTSGWPSRTTAATSTCSAAEGIPCVYIHSGYYDT